MVHDNRSPDAKTVLTHARFGTHNMVGAACLLSEKLNDILDLNISVLDNGWNWNPTAISEGHIINKPEPLFKKIDPDMIDEELDPTTRIS